MVSPPVPVLSLLLIAACQPAPQSTTTAVPSAPSSAAETPVDAAPAQPIRSKREVIVHNTGPGEGTVAVWVGPDFPGPEVPSTTLPRGTTKISLAVDEGLALRRADGMYRSWASTEGGQGELIVYAGCGAIGASDRGFSPRQLAIASPHVVDACCDACNDGGCTGCSESKPGTRCKDEQTLPGKCAVADDVLDCVPAASVDADGKAIDGFAPMRRMMDAARENE